MTRQNNAFRLANTSDRAGGSSGIDPSGLVLACTVLGAAGFAVLLWIAGLAAAVLSGHHVPARRAATMLAGLRTLAHPGDPSRGWRTAMPGPVPYWTITGLLLAVIAAGLVVVARALHRASMRRRHHPDRIPGLAARAEIRETVSARALLRRGPILRPTLTRPAPGDLGYRIGTARGLDVWTAVEESMLILGPPRSGKGRHLVIPMLRDAPGPVVTTSTRPDNIAATLPARQAHGPVMIFDPQHFAPHLTNHPAKRSTSHTAGDPDNAPSRGDVGNRNGQTRDGSGGMRWSLVRGCGDPQTAMIRARALAAGTGDHVENRSFWQAQTETALRAFLHAAALAGLTAVDLYRWSLDPAAAGHAVRILHTHSASAPGWADALDAIINGDPRTRDNSWAGIRTALAPLADPHTLAAVTPTSHGDELDPDEFLDRTGTVYLLGTATGAGATANLVAALIEDLVHTARRRAAHSPGTRLDPPLALILDEAANYTLPSLPSLISDGGGTGITTIAVLQSLAQARARWGEHDGTAIYDAASSKIILGGATNARDLHDLSQLIGERDEHTHTTSHDGTGRRGTSTSTRRVPIIDPAALRALPYGTALLLHRAIAPIPLRLRVPPNRPG